MNSAMKVDPWSTLFSPFLGWRFQFRNDTVVRNWFLSEDAIDVARTLRPQLGPESEIVLMQHRPPNWMPVQENISPKLWLTAMSDAIIPVDASHIAATHYGANLINVPDSGHDIMLDLGAKPSAQIVVDWLVKNLTLTPCEPHGN